MAKLELRFPKLPRMSLSMNNAIKSYCFVIMVKRHQYCIFSKLEFLHYISGFEPFERPLSVVSGTRICELSTYSAIFSTLLLSSGNVDNHWDVILS